MLTNNYHPIYINLLINEKKTIENIINEIELYHSKEISELICKMLCLNPDLRINADDIIYLIIKHQILINKNKNCIINEFNNNIKENEKKILNNDENINIEENINNDENIKNEEIKELNDNENKNEDNNINFIKLENDIKIDDKELLNNNDNNEINKENIIENDLKSSNNVSLFKSLSFNLNDKYDYKQLIIVNKPKELCKKIISNFEQYYTFIPYLIESKLVNKLNNNSVDIEYTAWISLFSINYTLTHYVYENEIVWDLKKAQIFKMNKGRWTFKNIDEGTFIK
jgi:hypothetical protein